jgi:hypothetical protein
MTVNSVDAPVINASSTASGRLCPKCGSSQVHRSHRRGAIERLLHLAGRRIRRCHACSARIVYFGNSAILVHDVARVARKTGLLCLMVAAMLAVAGAAMWLIGQQAALSQSGLILAPWLSLLQ